MVGAVCSVKGRNMTQSKQAIRRIRDLQAEGLSLPVAATIVVRRHPDKALQIMETIGSWPSSEPELRALRQAFESSY